MAILKHLKIIAKNKNKLSPVTLTKSVSYTLAKQKTFSRWQKLRANEQRFQNSRQDGAENFKESRTV
ncbi:MAG: hypothetical protein HGB19_01525 [Chlorobiales bacterium]|nr:hypothetical protein [Chlorobiales bacterium]